MIVIAKHVLFESKLDDTNLDRIDDVANNLRTPINEMAAFLMTLRTG